MSGIDHDTGSGNVFADIGLADSAEALVKARLALQIARIVKSRNLTQHAAAELMGISQAKVSALLRGKLHGVSESRLHRCLNGLGHDVRIVVSPRPRPGRGTTTVVAVRAARRERRRGGNKAAAPSG
jgi:predicted XRE-type DNA-binding protein